MRSTYKGGKEAKLAGYGQFPLDKIHVYKATSFLKKKKKAKILAVVSSTPKLASCYQVGLASILQINYIQLSLEFVYYH